MKHKKVRYKIAIPVIIVVILFTLGFSLFQISKSRSFQFFGGLTNRVDTEEKVVALTFDDAPTRYSDEVLETLKRKKVQATFYLIGNLIEKYPKEAQVIVDAGMEVGNHSYSHDRFLLKSQSFIDREVQTTHKLIRDLGYTGEITFRPPNGKKLFGLPWYLRQHSIHTIMWDVEPDTYVGSRIGKERTDFLVEYTLSHAKPGSIILLHPFCKDCTAERAAVEPIISGLQAKGYRLVTVGELLKYKKGNFIPRSKSN